MLKPRVQVCDENGVLVAEFWDCLRLDPAPVQELRSLYEAHLRQGGKPDLVVDLNGVTFAGSAALGGFLAILKSARAQAGRVIFCEVDLTVLEVFRVSKIEPLFQFVADRPAALALARSETAESLPLNSTPPAELTPRGGSPLKGRRRKT